MNEKEVRANMHASISAILKDNEGNKITPSLSAGMAYYMTEAAVKALNDFAKSDRPDDIVD